MPVPTLNQPSSSFQIVALGLAGLVLYFVPTFVAMYRRVETRGPIEVVNLFLGWTYVGWVVALAMAVGAKTMVQGATVEDVSAGVAPPIASGAVKQTKTADLYVEPGHFSTICGQVAAGTAIDVYRRKDDFVLVKTTDGDVGWTQRASVETKPIPSRPMLPREKTCPLCAERVKTAAKVCRYCRHNFDKD